VLCPQLLVLLPFLYLSLYCLSFKLALLITLWYLQTCLIKYWFDFPLVGIPRCRCKRHDVTEILLRLALSTNQSISQSVDIKQNIWSQIIRIFWRCRGVIRICKSVNRGTFRIMVMVFSTTFNNIFAILWLRIVLVEETGWSGENHRPAVSYWQTLSHKATSNTLVQSEDYYSISSLKQQSVDRHVAPLGHNILIPSQQVFALST
jgi:hypothetical protein